MLGLSSVNGRRVLCIIYAWDHQYFSLLQVSMSMAEGDDHGNGNLAVERQEINQMVKCRMSSLGIPLEDYGSNLHQNFYGNTTSWIYHQQNQLLLQMKSVTSRIPSLMWSSTQAMTWNWQKMISCESSKLRWSVLTSKKSTMNICASFLLTDLTFKFFWIFKCSCVILADISSDQAPCHLSHHH